MQQLIIKLSPQATENYLKIATKKTQTEMEHDMEENILNQFQTEKSMW